MVCPFCNAEDTAVVDSRKNVDGDAIRRRRECSACTTRFTTYEKLERSLPMLIKKDGRREEFDREKVIDGVKKACQKRPVGIKEIEELVDHVEQYLQELGEKEVSAVKVGEKVISEMYNLDDVAYVRFASVYRSFKDVNEFMVELKEVLKSKDSTKPRDQWQ